jgi:hypothetical protein
MKLRMALEFVVAVWWLAHVCDVQAMSIEQMKTLTGTPLLEWRVDALFRKCGLPSEILDPAGISRAKRKAHWGSAEMTLSPLDWEVIYARQRDTPVRESDWINPHPAGHACLADLSQLSVYASGNVGFLTVQKRADNKGYRTSYHVPNSLYAAHQIIGITGRWKRGLPVVKIRERYGDPDEVLDRGGGVKLYRYWVVERRKQMPVSLHAVDFEIDAAEAVCAQYTVQTRGVEFVQEKLDALLRQWEKDYVLD